MQNAPIHFGKITSTHGFKGHVMLNHQLKNNKELNNWQAIMLELKPASFIPFFIKEIRHTDANEAIVLLEEVESVEDAKKIVSCLAFIPPTVKSTGVLENEWAALIGYTVFEDKNSIGVITQIHENSMQQLFEIAIGEKLIHIPIQENFINQVDDKLKTITVFLPEGYLEIFTQ